MRVTANGVPFSWRERVGRDCQKKQRSRAQSGRLHPTITAGRDSPPDDKPPFSPNLVCGGGLSSPWACWIARLLHGRLVLFLV
jgi:hypothetical protein